jgi:Zn-dependent M28 family amino/carboxypeptidase
MIRVKPLAIVGVLSLLTLLTACTEQSGSSEDSGREALLPAIDSERLSSIVKTLASDEFEGRAPGGIGEEKTVAYLIERFTALGLEPGGEEGAWTQPVPLVHTQLAEDAVAAFSLGQAEQDLVQGRDVEFSTTRPGAQLSIDSAEVVFVGFGANAPERNWDDFGDVDLRGKLALFLVNDPDFAAAEDEPVAGRFGGKRMTYYGRWTYKFEEAARRGAIAALVIHETEGAGYGWNVASSSPGENYAIQLGAGAQQPVMLQGWLHQDAASSLFQSAGLSLAEQSERARREDFTAFTLGEVRFSARADVESETIISSNVLGVLPGGDHADETIMLSAHWDAYGLGAPDAEGNTVRPGANDDALGVAGILEIARVLSERKASGEILDRSIVFTAWTAEESGLLGSEYYASNPLYPLEKTAANLTLDILQTAGLARDVILVGEGQSDLENDLIEAARQQGRAVTPENLPENGLFFRADHFSLARRGVPVLLIMGIAGGADLIDGGRAAGDQWIADYTGNCYHQTCDAWSSDWDLSGAVQDIELFETITRDLATSRRWPAWKAGSEFRAVREATAQVRGR